MKYTKYFITMYNNSKVIHAIDKDTIRATKRIIGVQKSEINIRTQFYNKYVIQKIEAPNYRKYQVKMWEQGRDVPPKTLGDVRVFVDKIEFYRDGDNISAPPTARHKTILDITLDKYSPKDLKE